MAGAHEREGEVEGRARLAVAARGARDHDRPAGAARLGAALVELDLQRPERLAHRPREAVARGAAPLAPRRGHPQHDRDRREPEQLARVAHAAVEALHEQRRDRPEGEAGDRGEHEHERRGRAGGGLRRLRGLGERDRRVAALAHRPQLAPGARRRSPRAWARWRRSPRRAGGRAERPRTASALRTYWSASRVAAAADVADAVTLRMLLSPSGWTSTCCWTASAVRPPPRRRAASCAASGEATSAAAVCTVRVGSPESRSSAVPRKVRSSWGSGVTRSCAVLSYVRRPRGQERDGDSERSTSVTQHDDPLAGADRAQVLAQRGCALVRPGGGGGHEVAARCAREGS